MKILITGTAGFIGFSLVEKILEQNREIEIVGIDNINNYYTTDLKFARLEQTGISASKIEYGKKIVSTKNKNYSFVKMDLVDKDAIFSLFENENFDLVCNLAAQAGVRYSLENPQTYVDSNITGFLNILEACRYHNVKKLVYASSSSIYGNNKQIPFSTNQRTDETVSIYAATKKANEQMAYTYSHLFGIETIGLRFFTVYGAWGRPDMAYFLFTDAITNNREIKVFNNGKLKRDFTYIDDITEGLLKIISKSYKNEIENKNKAQVYNIGNNKPVELLHFISTLENLLQKKANKKMLPMQAGDVYTTYADVSELIKNFDYKPNTPIQTGLKKFVEWYKDFYLK